MTEPMAAAIASRDHQPETAFDALCGLAEETVGHRLFTLMTFDEATGEACRIYSNRPDVYPISGRKPADETKWTDIVIGGGKTFVANTIEGITEVFPDHELIRSLGCESVINVPIIAAGRFFGTINCLHIEGHYTPDRVAASERLKTPGAACFLLQFTLNERGLS